MWVYEYITYLGGLQVDDIVHHTFCPRACRKIVRPLGTAFEAIGVLIEAKRKKI